MPAVVYLYPFSFCTTRPMTRSGHSFENLPGLWVAPVPGTYLLWLDFRDCGLPAQKVGNFERMNIACPRSQLAEAMERIATAVRSLR